VQALGSVDKPRHPEEAWCDEDPSTALKGRRDAYVPEDGAFRSVPVYDGHRLRYGQRIVGPAIVEEVTTAIVLTGTWDAIVDRYGSFVLHRKGRDDLVAPVLESRKQETTA
jgi:N-methylhydantoinase A